MSAAGGSGSGGSDGKAGAAGNNKSADSKLADTKLKDLMEAESYAFQSKPKVVPVHESSVCGDGVGCYRIATDCFD